jgi:O-antigen ligase
MFCDIGVIAILYFAALAFGSRDAWAMALITLATIVVLGVRLFYDSWQDKVKFVRFWEFIPFVLLLIYVGLQRLHTIAGLQSGPASRPHTLASYSTTLYLGLAFSYVCIMLLTANGFRSRTRMKLLVFCILLLGAFEAVYGLFQYLGDYDLIWGVSIFSHSGVAHGTIANRNHYALLLNISICCGVGFLYYRSVSLLRGQNLTIRQVIGAPGSAKLVWIFLWLALIGLALIFSMSRMGILAMLGGIGTMVIAGKLSEMTKRSSTLGIFLLFAIIGLALYTGLDAVMARYETMTQSGYFEKDRGPIWRDTWTMVQGHLVFGQGLGAFQWIFPAYEQMEPDVPAKWAHNDYLQALAEVGIVGLLLLAWAFVACWRTAVRNLVRSDDPLVRGIGLATLGALVATALQEITDYSLCTPGVAVLLAILVGLNFRASIARLEG